MVWDPARIVPRPWEDVVELYRHLTERNDDFRPLLQLVEHVASQPYAGSVVAATSGTALLMAREAAADWTADALRIDIDLSGTVHFAQLEKRLVKPTAFKCEAEQIVEAIERYLGVSCTVAHESKPGAA